MCLTGCPVPTGLALLGQMNILQIYGYSWILTDDLVGSLVLTGLALLGQIDEKMVYVTPVAEPVISGRQEHAFISKARRFISQPSS